VSNNKPFVKSNLLRYIHFNSKTIYKKQRTTRGIPHPKPTDLDMTKYSDYFVWKDTSERVARRCDYTVDKKRVNSCVLKHLFLEGVQPPKIWPKKPGNALSDALLMSCFQKITEKNRAPRGFLKPRFARFAFFRSQTREGWVHLLESDAWQTGQVVGYRCNGYAQK